MRRKERSEKKKVKFAVPAKKKAEPQPKKKPVKEDKEEDKSSNTSEPLLVGSRRSKRMMERKEEESDEEDSDNDNKNEKKNPNSAQKSAERKREIKEKNKAFLKSHGIEGDMQEKWSELLSKDKLSPLEKIQEAVFTEIINKESLLYLQQMENERVNELWYRDRRPKGPSVKLVQDIKNGHFKSSMIFPTSEFYPKNFNTKKERKKEKYYYQMNTWMITGKKAKYKDPLTLTPYANKDAFKVIRERFFQKEEDKLNMRIHIINELLNQKRDKLKRYQSFDRNLEISQEQREVIMKNAQKMQFGQYR